MTILAAGQRIADRYQLEHRIAVGGMGEVWEAVDTRLGRSVAVKVLRPELSDDPEFLHRFRIEARTVASLDHSGIAAVHDYGEDAGPSGRPTAYLVMELVRGEPLSTLISRGPIDTEETLRIVEEAAWALQAAHDRGFVHRDVKPGNILVRNDGVIKLTDFGIAKAADAVPVTRSGMVMGTAHYIAPEQASGSEAGPAGDVYSLGIVGYECLAGHRPFRAESAVAVAMMQVRDDPPPLPGTVPVYVRMLIEATLVKDPTRRYSTGGEFAAAVAAIRRGEHLPAPGANPGATYTPARARQPVSLATPPPAPALPEEHEPPRTPHREPAHREAPHREPAHRQPRRGPATGTGSLGTGSLGRGPAGPPSAGQPLTGPARSARSQQAASAPRERTPAAQRAQYPGPATQPLRLNPTARSSRTLLLVLFVLLTVAAVVVGAFVVFRNQANPENSNSAPPDGTVTTREAVFAGSAVPELLGSATVTWSVR